MVHSPAALRIQPAQADLGRKGKGRVLGALGRNPRNRTMFERATEFRGDSVVADLVAIDEDAVEAKRPADRRPPIRLARLERPERRVRGVWLAALVRAIRGGPSAYFEHPVTPKCGPKAAHVLGGRRGVRLLGVRKEVVSRAREPAVHQPVEDKRGDVGTLVE